MFAFPCQQWLCERALILRYTYSTLPALLLSERLVTTGHVLSLAQLLNSPRKFSLY